MRERPTDDEIKNQIAELHVARHVSLKATAAVLGMSYASLWKHMVRLGISRRPRVVVPPDYYANHSRVKKLRGTPKRCEDCGSTDPKRWYEWANITGNYADPNDYKRLCRSCHRKFDATKNL